MFEQIRFEKIHHRWPRGPCTNQTVEDAFSDNISDFSDFFITDKKDVSYSLDGISETVVPAPVSEFAQQNLLNIQVFSLNDAGKKFYTSRKNFPFYLLLYTYEGEGTLEYEGHTYTLVPDSVFLINCKQEHTYYTSGTHWKHAILHYTGHTSDWLYKQFTDDGTPIFLHKGNHSFQSNIENLLLCYQKVSPYREYEVSMILSTLLMDLIKVKNKDLLNVPDYIRYLQRYLESNFTKRLTLDELADFAGLSKYHLEREFKKYIGYSVNAYLIELRLSRACFLLSNTQLTIGQISDISGFSNYANFLKLFKDRKGVSPKEYRS